MELNYRQSIISIMLCAAFSVINDYYYWYIRNIFDGEFRY